MAAALLYLREHGLADYEALAASTEAAVDRAHKLAEELRDTEAALSKTSELMGAVVPVSYTHLDVYKRQHAACAPGCAGQTAQKGARRPFASTGPRPEQKRRMNHVHPP